MKSGKSRKKSLVSVNTSFDMDLGDDGKPSYIIPEPYRATCHVCSPFQHFMSIGELQEHFKVEHEGRQK